MTDFLQWWADHWPLIPFVIAMAPVIYHGWRRAYSDYLWWRGERRREP